jgi:chromosomal replication initiation ATPase DnaA
MPPTPEMAAQLVLPFGVQPALKRETFITAPCNVAALAFVQRWPDWPQRAAALYGPAGSGKSHLAAIWAEVAAARRIAAHELTPDALEIPNGSAAFVIEDFDREPANASRDYALLSLFDRPATWLLLTGRTAPSQWSVAVADLASRLVSLISLPVWAPDDALLSALVRKHFADRQLDVSDAVARRIITQVERTPEAVAAFVARADSKALAEKRGITDRLIVELLDSGATKAGTR